MRRAACVLVALTTACIDDVVLARVASPDGAVDVPALDAPTDAPLDASSEAATDRPGVDAADVSGDALADVAPDAASAVVVQVVLRASREGESSRAWHTELDVTLTRDGAPATGVTPTLSSSSGAVSLESAGSGRYTASSESMAAWYELTLTTRDGRVGPQRLPLLAPHTLTAPRTDQVVPALMPVVVTWSPSGAEFAQFTSPTGLAPMADTGMATLPGTLFSGMTREVYIRLQRRASMALPGFGVGSSVRTELTNETHVVVMP